MTATGLTSARRMVARGGKKVFLLGRGITGSLSVPIHNAAFEESGINAAYELRDLTRRSLASFVSSLRASTNNEVLGFNVTAPFKEEVVPYLSSTDRRSKSIGAVNTVKLSRRGEMRGYNTDYDGIVASLSKIGARRKRERSALMLGAGGAARACVSVLVDLGYSDITILNRTLRRAKDIERQFSTKRRSARQGISSATLTEDNLRVQLRSGCDLVVNAISDSGPGRFPIGLDFSAAKEGCAVFDLGYKEESLLLSRARQAGLRNIDGLLMLVVQAAKSFEIWTGKEAPVETMMRAAEDARRTGLGKVGARAREPRRIQKTIAPD